MKSGMTDAKMLAVRCLNETRLLHPPTYVASRYLADSIASDSSSSWTPAAITRRYPVQNTPRFFKFLRFKKRLENHQIEYREFLVPSPMSCLAEALVLRVLSGMETFQKPASVYSYRWPSFPACPYNFDHYANGYRKRNRNISDVLRLDPRRVAIVTDIEKFYPTISHAVVRQRFQSRLVDAAIDSGVRETALNLFEHLLSAFPNGKGIATGPELSHVIGDLALSEVDEEFERRFPGRYVRYVDDIVFVVEPGEKQQALNLLNQLLQNAELKANPDKADSVSSDEWLAHGPDHRRIVTEYSFEALVFRLKVFLAVKPDSFEKLDSVLWDQGFSLPLGRIRGAANTNAFKRRLTVFHRRGWQVLLRALFDSEKSLVEYAFNVRKAIQQRLVSLFGSGFPNAATRRRWHAQRVRYLTNRILYLLPAPELRFVRDALANQPEFTETLALLKLLQDGDCSDLLEMPGPAVAAAAAILRAAKTQVSTITSPAELSGAATHSAGILLLYGAAEFGAPLRANAGPDALEFLSFCAGDAPQRRVRNDFGYLDEIRSLQLNRKAEERLQMLESRFSENEAITFEALEIGEEYFT